jgi:biopolymer transport protein ExbB
MNLIEQLIDYLSAGGYVMPPLVLLTLMLWYALGYRYAVLRNTQSLMTVRTMMDRYENGRWSASSPQSKTGELTVIENAIIEAYALRDHAAKPLRKYLDASFYPVERELSRYQVLIKTIVSITPLLGLLGTVAGMIETFDSLQDMELFSQSGGIAGGISQALVTTQYGLAVAIPGLIINGILNRRKSRVEMQLAQIKDIISVRMEA